MAEKQSSPPTKARKPEPKITAAPEAPVIESPLAAAIPQVGSTYDLPEGPGTRALRQAAVMRLQQQQGNTHVLRFLNTRPPSLTVPIPRPTTRNRPVTPEPVSEPELEREPETDEEMLVQRQEEGAGEQEPTPEQKAAALAAAQAAEAIANQAQSKGQEETSKSRDAKAKETTEKEAAQQVGEQTKGKGEAPKEPGEKGKSEPKAAAKKPADEMDAAAPVPSTNGTGPQDRAPTSSAEDPTFQGVVAKAKGAGAKTKAHDPAEKKAKESQDAAEMPAAEISGRAAHDQTGKVEQAEAPAFDAAAFKAKLMERIEAIAPKSAQEADNFKGSGKVDGVKSAVQGQVGQEKEKSSKPTKEANAAAPDPGSVPPKPVTPIPDPDPGTAPSIPDAAKATPKPKTPAEVEQPLADNAKTMDEKMAEAEITDEQLANSNEPEFTGALEAKKEAKTSAKESPQTYRQGEEAQIKQAEGAAQTTTEQSLAGMQGDKAAALQQVLGQQGATKGKDEQARQKVGQDIEKIYQRTKGKVEKILGDLDGKVEKAFDTAAAAAKKVFEDFVDAKMTAYKEKRYGGWLGWAKWAKDKLLGMPGEVNAFYSEGRQLYLQKMDAVIDEVTAIIGNALTSAKAEVAKGKQEIQEYLSQLPEDLKEVGQQAAQDIQGKFDELEQSIDAKQNDLIDKLAQKYQENLQAIDARIEELKAANKGLVDKAIDAIGGVIKTILKLKEMLTSILSRALDAIKAILKDPIGFLGNLISAVKQGLTNFVSNIGTHLKKGLMTWLFGEAAKAGIQLPQSFDLKGILTLVLQILGVTWENLRGRAVKLFGEPVVAALEKSWAVFKMIQTQGIGALWEYIKDQLSNLKEMVIDGIKDMVITEVIKAGIQWLIGILGGPAGAFIKAAKAIYDIIMWFVNNGSKLMALVDAVISSVSAIASGGIAGAAKFIENALAQAIPLVIGFLASLLGLGGLSEKIKGIIQKIQAPINKAIDWVLGKAKAMVKKLGGMLFGKDKKAKDKMKYTDKDRSAGVTAIETTEKKYAKNNEIGQDDAKKVTADVKKKHPVFESLQVIDGKDSWDYQYVLRKKSGVKDTPAKKAASFKKELEQVDAAAKPDIEAALERKKSSLAGKTWDQAKAAVIKDATFKTIYDEPLLKSHTFGQKAHGQAVRALENAAKRLKKEDKIGDYEQSVNSRKQFIHKGTAGYGTDALEKLREQIFDGAKMGAATQVLRKTFEFVLENDTATPLHEEYKPENLKVKKQGGNTIVTYTTPAGGSFRAVIDKEGMVTSIKGTSLSRKVPGTRGVTERSPGYEANMSMNASHLIGDLFSGSGYRASSNLVSASAHFNQKIMGAAEKTIDSFFNQISGQHGVSQFEMTVNVTWGKLDDSKVNKILEREVKRQKIKIDIADANSKLKAVNSDLQRCMNVEYIVKITDGKGKAHTLSPPPTGPDLWFGSD